MLWVEGSGCRGFRVASFEFWVQGTDGYCSVFRSLELMVRRPILEWLSHWLRFSDFGFGVQHGVAYA